MRVLLDESLPRHLANEILGHEVWTVPQKGWAGTKNGELLRLAVANFDVFVTADSSLKHQQAVGRVGSRRPRRGRVIGEADPKSAPKSLAAVRQKGLQAVGGSRIRLELSMSPRPLIRQLAPPNQPDRIPVRL